LAILRKKGSSMGYGCRRGRRNRRLVRWIIALETVALLLSAFPSCRRGPRLPEGHWRVRALSFALRGYEIEHGYFPYHELGPDHALFLLRPYAPDASVTFLGRDLGAGLFDAWRPDAALTGPAYWDEEGRRLVGGDFDYINADGLANPPGRFEGRMVILAEKTGLRTRGKWCVLQSGHAGWYEYQPGAPIEILGRELRAKLWLGP
jgi:hypothetical protein